VLKTEAEVIKNNSTKSLSSHLNLDVQKVNLKKSKLVFYHVWI